MSAIWGVIKTKKEAVIPENAYNIMKECYENRCKIDRYNMLKFDDGFFACGIQYITPQAHLDKLPCSNGKGLYFTSDCMVDNPHGEIPDGEFLYEKYLEKGPDALKEIYGAYSVAVWDSFAHTLHLCADPAASRCLYYYQSEGLIIFSTLIEPILKIFPHIEINENYIKDFLIAPALVPNLVPRECAYAGIKKVIPGYYISFSGDSVIETRYFDPHVYNKSMKVRTIKQTDKTFRSLYEECVKVLLRNEVTGVAMSSGLDSSSIAVLAANHIKETSYGRLLAYTYVPAIDIPSSADIVTDETKDVKQILRYNSNIEPHFINNNGKSCMAQIPEIVSLTEMPIKAVVNFPNLLELYDKASQDGCKVVMNGQFGNSTVSNGRPDNILFDKYTKHRYLSLISDIFHISGKLKTSPKRLLKVLFHNFKDQKKYLKNPTMIWESNYLNTFLNQQIGDNYPAKERFSESGFLYDRNTFCDEKNYKHELFHHPSFTYIGEIETKLGLKYGVIIRDPTRDARMLSFCAKIPYSHFAYHGTPRCLIRRNLRDLIPVEILDNWKRVGKQNADWVLRLDRDKESVISILRNSLLFKDVKHYGNTILLEKAIDSWENGKLPEPQELMNILFIYSAFCFYKTI